MVSVFVALCSGLDADDVGQFFDLLEIFRLNGYPSDTHAYLFNGDFVDRGSWSTEIALLLYAYKWLRPNGIFLNRGNHETDDMNKVYGFEGECRAKYNETMFKVFSESFSALPLATLIGNKYLVLHGGLFSDDNTTLDDIRKLNRHNQRQPGQQGLMMEMLWTDPQTEPGRGPSKRGVGLQFGPDVTKRFCEKNGLEAIIRSHEVRMEGYEVEHDGRCITVFSAPKYCDATENKGAFIKIGPELKLDFQVFEAVPHPDIKPMVGVIAVLNFPSTCSANILPGLCAKLDLVDDVSWFIVWTALFGYREIFGLLCWNEIMLYLLDDETDSCIAKQRSNIAIPYLLISLAPIYSLLSTCARQTEPDWWSEYFSCCIYILRRGKSCGTPRNTVVLQLPANSSFLSLSPSSLHCTSFFLHIDGFHYTKYSQRRKDGIRSKNPYAPPFCSVLPS